MYFHGKGRTEGSLHIAVSELTCLTCLDFREESKWLNTHLAHTSLVGKGISLSSFFFCKKEISLVFSIVLSLQLLCCYIHPHHHFSHLHPTKLASLFSFTPHFLLLINISYSPIKSLVSCKSPTFLILHHYWIKTCWFHFVYLVYYMWLKYFQCCYGMLLLH